MERVITDEEIAAARKRGEERERTEPRIDAARYDVATGRVTLDMRGGATVIFDPRVLPSLVATTDAQLADLTPEENGGALFWNELDVQATTIALLGRVFGIRTAAAAAGKAGATLSAAKSAAARANGTKGGRPRKMRDVKPPGMRKPIAAKQKVA